MSSFPPPPPPNKLNTKKNWIHHGCVSHYLEKEVDLQIDFRFRLLTRPIGSSQHEGPVTYYGEGGGGDKTGGRGVQVKFYPYKKGGGSFSHAGGGEF